jgi:hypothetical protein
VEGAPSVEETESPEERPVTIWEKIMAKLF